MASRSMLSGRPAPDIQEQSRQGAIRLALSNETRGGRRLPVLQALIVFAVVGLLAALAIPALAGQAKESVLRQNQATLAPKLRTQLVLALEEGPLPSASPSVDEDAPGPLAASVACLVRDGAADGFVNPYSGSSAVVSTPSLSVRDTDPAPAVWITDDGRYILEHFQPTALTRSSLGGSLVIAVGEPGGGTVLQLYYVDAEGRASRSMETLRLE